MGGTVPISQRLIGDANWSVIAKLICRVITG